MNGSSRVVQNFLDSRETLIREFLKKDSGFAVSRRYAGLIDRFIHNLFREAVSVKGTEEDVENRVALIALGSYGRQELCLGSDVDFLVLHRGDLSVEMGEMIARILYALWDANLSVGHTVLTPQEGVRLAMDDFKTLTSLMDGRYLLGSRSLQRLFRRSLWARIEKDRDALLEHFLVARAKRKEKFSRQGYFEEPDLKEGLGGIRDLHFMEWMARLYFNCKRFSQIRRFEAFSHFEINRLNHSKSFLLKIRNHLHMLANRREDRLLFSFQKPLARSLGYRDGHHISAAEKFLRRLYMHMNRVRYGTDEFHTKALDLIDPRPFEVPPERLPSEFRILKGNLVLKEGSLFEKNPLVILRAFREANKMGLFLGSGLIWEVRKRLAEQGRGLVRLPGAKEIFLEIIERPENPKILRLALELGLISLFIPEFKKIRNLALFSYYHEETVDLHSLRTVEMILEISKGSYDERWRVLREVFEALEHPEWLYLTALLHDIGKGYRGDHAKKGENVIPRILRRLGITGPALRMVPFLIKNHLLLARVSQRRDLNEEKTAEQVAQTVRDQETLRLLFMLTTADTLCSGPTANSDWNIMLLDELFFKVQHILERGVLASPDATRKVEDIKKALYKELRPHYRKKDILALMEQIPTRYLLYSSPEDIARHFRLALSMKKEKLSWVLQKLEHAPVTRVVLRTQDRPGLFSKMVGVFAMNNIEVLSAKIYTLKNGQAFDVYEVTNPLDPYREKEMWKKIRKEAIEAIEDRMPLDDLIARKYQKSTSSEDLLSQGVKEVKVDNEASDFFTIIEVSASERFGLLYSLAKKLFSLGLDIRLAMVNNDKVKVTGVFYVSDPRGQKILDPPAIRHIKHQIFSGLS